MKTRDDKQKVHLKLCLLIILGSIAHSTVVLTDPLTQKITSSISFHNNKLIVKQSPLPRATYFSPEIVDQFAILLNDSERRLQQDYFSKKLKNKFKTVLLTQSCQPHFASSRLLRTRISNNLIKFLDVENFDQNKFDQILKEIGKAGQKYYRQNYMVGFSAEKAMEDKALSKSLEALSDFLTLSCKNRLKKGFKKILKEAVHKVHSSINKVFHSSCRRRKLIDESNDLKLANYFLENLNKHLKTEKLEEVQKPKEHLKNILSETRPWKSLGVIDDFQKFSIESVLQSVFQKYQQEVNLQKNYNFESMFGVHSQVKEKMSLSEFLTVLSKKMSDEPLIFDDISLFKSSLSTLPKKFSDFFEFIDKLRRTLLNMRFNAKTSSEQINRILNVPRKLFLKNDSEENQKFNFSKLKKEMFLELSKDKNRPLYNSFIKNILNKQIVLNESRNKSSNQTQKIKSLFENIDQNINEAIDLEIIPKKPSLKYVATLKKDVLNHIKQIVLRTKNLKHLKNLKVGKLTRQSSRFLTDVHKNEQKFTHVMLKNLLSRKYDLNDRYLKRCKKMFFKQSTKDSFSQLGFFMVLVKMFCEANKDEEYESSNALRVKLSEYLDTLEYFKFITLEERNIYLDHLVLLMYKYVDHSTRKFKLDDFYVAYNMILTPQEPIDFDSEQSLENWPTQLRLQMLQRLKGDTSNPQFVKLQNMIEAFKDNKANVVVADKEAEALKRLIVSNNLKSLADIKAFIITKLESLLSSTRDNKMNVNIQDLPEALQVLLIKSMLKMFMSVNNVTIAEVSGKLSKLKDNLVDVKIPEKQKEFVKFFIKSLTTCMQMGLLHMNSSTMLKTVAVKVADFLVKVSPKLSAFVLRGVFTDGPFFQAYMNYKMHWISKMVKDMHIDIKSPQVSFLITSMVKMSAMFNGHQTAKVEALMKKFKDEFIVPDKKEYVHYISSALSSIAAIAAYSNLSSKLMLSCMIDNFIPIAPKLISFYISSGMISKGDLQAMSTMKLQGIIKELKDYHINVVNHVFFVLRNILNQNTQFSFKGQAEVSAYIKSKKDYHIQISPNVKAFMIDFVTSVAKEGFASSKQLTLQQIWKIVKDKFVHVKQSQEYLLASYFKTLVAGRAANIAQLTSLFKKINDRYIVISPSLSQFLLKSIVSLRKLKTISSERTKFSLFLQTMADHLIRIEPDMTKFLLKSEIKVSKNNVTAYTKSFFKQMLIKLQDRHIPVHKEDLYIAMSMLKILAKINFTEISKLKLVLKKFKDSFLSAEKLLTFLASSIIDFAGTQISMSGRTNFKAIYKNFRDMFIEADPAMQKFLLSNNSRLIPLQVLSKLSKIKTQFIRMRDYLVSPQPLKDYLLSAMIFDNSVIKAKKLSFLKANYKKLKDFMIYVNPGQQKFLLSSFYHFFKGLQFSSEAKVKFMLKQFIDHLIVPEADREFLTDAFSKLTAKFFAMKNSRIRFQAAKFKDEYVSVEMLDKYLLSTQATNNQKKSFKEIMQLKASYMKIKDFLLSPMNMKEFLLSTILMGGNRKHLSTLIKQHYKQVLIALKDNHILAEPGMMKFILGNYVEFIKPFQFYNESKLKFLIKRFADNLILPEPQRIFLLKFLLQFSLNASTSTHTSLKLSLEKMNDQFIAVEPQGIFLLSNATKDQLKVLVKKVSELKATWIKMRDFFISPLNEKQFILFNLLINKSNVKMEKTQRLTLINKIVKDFHILADPAQVKFILSVVLNILSNFEFSSQTKLKFFMSKLLDQFIMVESERTFLLSVIMKLTSPAFIAYKHLKLSTMYKEFIDLFIPTEVRNFILTNQLNNNMLVTMKKIEVFKSFWMKFKDYFLSPMNLRQFVLFTAMFFKGSIQAKKITKLSLYNKILQDYKILVEPAFVKFLLTNMTSFLSDLQFSSIAKFRLCLKSFMDQLIIPEPQRIFLLSVMLKYMIPKIAVSQKLDLKFMFDRFKDAFLGVEIPNKFLLQNGVTINTDVMQKKISKLKTFWKIFQDYLIKPERLDTYLLSALIDKGKILVTQYQQLVFKYFNLKIKDFLILAEPGHTLFLLQNLMQMLSHIIFSKVSKVKLFLMKFVDSLIVPENMRTFLLNALLEIVLPKIEMNKKVDVKFIFKDFMDYFIEVERNGIFLLQSKLEYKAPTVEMQKVAKLNMEMKRLKDFYLSPLNERQFVLFNTLFNKNDIMMTKAMKYKLLQTQLRDFLNLVDPNLRKFLLSNLLSLLSNISYSSKSKVKFILKSFLDMFILTKPERLFLLNTFMAYASQTFVAYSKLKFGAEFKKMVDEFLAVEIDNKYLLQSTSQFNSDVMKKKVSSFKEFLMKIQDFLIIPMSNEYMLAAMIAFKGANPTSAAYRSIYSQYKIFRDNHILSEPGFIKFLLGSVSNIISDIRFSKISKVRFFLTKAMDYLINVEDLRHFMVNFIMKFIGPVFEAKKSINLSVIFKNLKDEHIDVESRDYLLQSMMITKLNKFYAQKISNLKIIFNKLQDFLLSPEPLSHFVINSLLQFKIKDLSFLRILSPKVFFIIMKDFHIATPGVLEFILFNLVRHCGNIEFNKKTELKLFLKKYLDHFIEIEMLGRGAPFLLQSLMKFASKISMHKVYSLKEISMKYLDELIEVHPENQFLASFLTDQKMFTSFKKVYGIKTLMKTMKDEKIEVDRQVQIFLNLMLHKKGIDVAEFNTRLDFYMKNIRDYLIHVEQENYVLKNILFGKYDISASQQLNMKSLLKTIEDEHITPMTNIWVLKNLIEYFHDISINNQTQLKFLLKRYFDHYQDVFSKRLLDELSNEYDDLIYLDHHYMQFDKILSKIKMEYLRHIKDLNMSHSSSMYEHFLEYFGLNFSKTLSKTKMEYLRNIIKDVNINSIMSQKENFTEEQSMEFYTTLFNTRMAYLRRFKGFNMSLIEHQDEAFKSMLNQEFTKDFVKNKLKQYVKDEEYEMLQDSRKTESQGFKALQENSLLSKTKVKMYDQGKILKGDFHHHLHSHEVKQIRDDLSKLFMKTVSLNLTKTLKTSVEGGIGIAKLHKERTVDLDKIYMKLLHTEQFTTMSSKKHHFKVVATELKTVRDDFQKLIYNQLKFEEKAGIPSISRVTGNKNMVNNIVHDFNSKLQSIQNVFLRSMTMPNVRYPTKSFKSFYNKSDLFIKTIEKNQNLESFKKSYLRSHEMAKRIAKLEDFRMITDKVKNQIFNYTQDFIQPFSKIMIKAITTSGNKVSTDPTEEFLLDVTKTMSEYSNSQKIVKGSSKMLLNAITTPGNKLNPQDVRVNEMVSQLRKHYLRKGQLTPLQFAKILVRHFYMGPKFYTQMMKLLKTEYNQVRNKIMDKPLSFSKMLLYQITTPGNKVNKMDTKQSEIRAEANKIKNEIQKFKATLAAAKKIYLRGHKQCCCCCEYYVTNCCDGESDQESLEEYYVDSALKKMEEEHDDLNDTEKFDEIVKGLEEADDFECESGPRNMVYNIMPEVKIHLNLKKPIEEYQKEFDYELTETKDIKHIIGEEFSPMYQIGPDFIEKMGANEMLLDEGQFKPRRKNLFYKSEDYAKENELIRDEQQMQSDNADGMLLHDPDIDMKEFEGKDYHEEHEQTRNNRLASYGMDPDVTPSDIYYERVLRDIKVDQSKMIELDSSKEESVAEEPHNLVSNLEDTIDKL